MFSGKSAAVTTFGERASESASNCVKSIYSWLSQVSAAKTTRAKKKRGGMFVRQERPCLLYVGAGSEESTAVNA